MNFICFSLKDFHVNVKNKIEDWKSFYDSPNPHESTFPDPYGNLEEMLKLIVLKCFRSDKIVPAIRVSVFLKHFIKIKKKLFRA